MAKLIELIQGSTSSISTAAQTFTLPVNAVNEFSEQSVSMHLPEGSTGLPESEMPSHKPEIENYSGNSISQAERQEHIESREALAPKSRRRKRSLDPEVIEERRSRMEEHRKAWEEERAAYEAMSEEEKQQMDISKQRESLLDHIRPRIQKAASYGRTVASVVNINQYVQFEFEMAPDVHRVAKCKFVCCGGFIEGGSYRIAVRPGNTYHWSGSPEYYHIRCFEKLADLSSLDFVTRFTAVSKQQADAGGIAIFNTWKKDLLQEIQGQSRSKSALEVLDASRQVGIEMFSRPKSASAQAAEAEKRADAVTEVSVAISPPEEAPQNTAEAAPEEVDSSTDILLEKILSRQDVGEKITEAEVAAIIAQKRTEIFLQHEGAVILTVKPTLTLDKKDENGEWTYKAINGDSSWQILQYLYADYLGRSSDRDAASQINTSSSVEKDSGEVQASQEAVDQSEVGITSPTRLADYMTTIRQLYEPKDRLSSALLFWTMDQNIALAESDDDLSDDIKKYREANHINFTKGDRYRIESWASICINTRYGYPFVIELRNTG